MTMAPLASASCLSRRSYSQLTRSRVGRPLEGVWLCPGPRWKSAHFRLIKTTASKAFEKLRFKKVPVRPVRHQLSVTVCATSG